MALVKNPPNPPADEMTDAVIASKSGKTPFDAQLLTVLKRIAAALEARRA